MEMVGLLAFTTVNNLILGFSGGSVVKNPLANVGDASSIFGLGRFPGEGTGTPPQYSCLENPMDGGAWRATIHGVAKSQTQLHFHFSLSFIGKGNGNPLKCSCLENPRDGGAWWAAVYGVALSWTRLKRLSSSSNGQESLDMEERISQ